MTPCGPQCVQLKNPVICLLVRRALWPATYVVSSGVSSGVIVGSVGQWLARITLCRATKTQITLTSREPLRRQSRVGAGTPVPELAGALLSSSAELTAIRLHSGLKLLSVCSTQLSLQDFSFSRVSSRVFQLGSVLRAEFPGGHAPPDQGQVLVARLATDLGYRLPRHGPYQFSGERLASFDAKPGRPLQTTQ
jgi:hypothetical protein